MNTFVLKTKEGEIIHKLRANDIENAKEMFAIIKNLSISEILSMFVVEELVK